VEPTFEPVPLDRQLKIAGVPKGTLLSFQVCAIYNSNIESLITWDSVNSQLVDLVALEGLPTGAGQPSRIVITSPLAPRATDESPLSAMPPEDGPMAGAAPNSMVFIPPSDNANNQLVQEKSQNDADQQVPFVIRLGVRDSSPPFGHYWSFMLAAIFLALLMAICVFAFLLRMTKRKIVIKKEKIAPIQTLPIAVITKAPIQPASEKEKLQDVKEPEKTALP